MNDAAFTRKIFYRFFFPSVGACVCLAVANLADALCAGMLLGEPALAAISLVLPLYMVFNVLDLSIAAGGSVIFARLLGEGKIRQAADVFGQSLLAALLCGVGTAVLGLALLEPVLGLLGTSPEQGAVYEMTRDYAVRLLAAAPLFFLNMLFYYFLRCDNGERRASIGLAAANVLDVGLSFVLVLGFRMGIKGAIYATIAGTAAGILIYLPHFFRKENILKLKLVRPDRTQILLCFRTGFATASEYIGQFVLSLVINNLLIRVHGAGALAVWNVVMDLSYLTTGLFNGIAAALQPLAATFHGERNREAKQGVCRLALLWGGLLGSLLLTGICLFAGQLSRLFGLSEEMLAAGTLALRCYCLGSLGAGASILLASYWQAVEKERQAMILTLMRSLVLYLCLAVPLALGPLERFWLIFPAVELSSLMILWIWRAVTGRISRLHLLGLDEQPVLHRLLRQDLTQLSGLLEACEDFCAVQGASMQQTFLVTMAVEEMCQAIFLHTQGQKKQDVYIQITLYQSQTGVFDLHIRDNAVAFDPFSLHTQKITEAASEDSAMDSMGVLMVKKKAKECYYRHFQGFNTLLVRI